MKDEKKAHSSESDRQARIRANLAEARQLREALEKKYGKVERLSEEEREWRWRNLMRHRQFLDDV